MEPRRMKSSISCPSGAGKYRRFRSKMELEERALVLTIQKAEEQLKRLNGDGYSSETEDGIEDEREAWAARTNFHRRRLRLVRQSLERMRSGEYGICGSCDQRIRVKRLNAMPTAMYCLECQQQLERQTAGMQSRPFQQI